jgi:ribosomal protein S18 acetylase RimI-like enzyme
MTPERTRAVSRAEELVETSGRVVAARPTDMEPLINVMVLPFAADPVAHWMYRDLRRYLAYFGRSCGVRGQGLFDRDGMVLDGNLGGAMWLPPGVEPDEDAIAAFLDPSVPRELMTEVNTMFSEMAAYHPSDPHWYLPTIGVEPHLHRKGLGSALLTRGLRRCDEEHMPAYLEASNSANVALYWRFGFEVLGVIHVGNSPPMIPMRRGASS